MLTPLLILAYGVVGAGCEGAGRWAGETQPYFAALPTNLTLTAGHTARLTCRVHMLQDKSVTWMRVRDLHILTIDLLTYTADDRFRVVHGAGTDDWTLELRYTQGRDSGAYKCQVNTNPKISRTVYLSVTDTSAEDGRPHNPVGPTTTPGSFFRPTPAGEYATQIRGSASRILQAGSSLELQCVVVAHGRTPAATLLWYHDHTQLDYDSPRGGISIKVEKLAQQTTSTLLLSAVTMADTGNYTCLPANGPAASVTMHVNNGELGAAVQLEGVSRGASHAATRPAAVVTSLLLLLLLLTHCRLPNL